MPVFMATAKLEYLLPNYAKKCQKSTKLRNPNFHCQTPLKNAKCELFGIVKCQLATLEWGERAEVITAT